MRYLIAVTLTIMILTAAAHAQMKTNTVDLSASVASLTSELVAKYGEAQRERVTRGLKQAASFWRTEDGDAAAFEELARTYFAGDPKTLDETFTRLMFAFESLDGHMAEIARDFNRQSALDIGPIQPIDELLAAYDPSAHINDDFFANRLAFVVLLNFPLTTLEQRNTEGEKWSRRQWAEARLAQRFSKRVPADVNLAISQAYADTAQYIAQYNIWMHHLLDDKGQRLFPEKLRLLSHWNLRDEIKGNYSNRQSGLAKQRMIQKVMERIVTQTIPAAVIDNPGVDWNPVTNEVKVSSVRDFEGNPKSTTASNTAEPSTRYAMLLKNFQAAKKLDPYSPTAPTQIARSFDENRELSEARVRDIFVKVLTSPHVARTAKLIEKRLGRPLEPFDIWYNGFRPNSAYSEAQLDEIVAKKYPTAAAFEADIPNILMKLGFSAEKAKFLAEHITVDPARGSGHALGAERRGDKARLRTRVEKSGMNYKGYNIAVHELGHNVEQTFGLENIDFITLQGVPNNAFTEALAFVFQAHDLELLGLTKPDAESQALKTLNDFWATYEIAGVALVDMDVWKWLYAHPDATPEQLRDATVQISKDVWNKYYAPVFKKRDVVLLGIYSHMIEYPMYLPDYPLGHLIAFQIEEQMEKAGSIGPEFERVSTQGSLTPDLWMRKATGSPVGPDALLHATERALEQMEKKR